jgi:hypothetical protein
MKISPPCSSNGIAGIGTTPAFCNTAFRRLPLTGLVASSRLPSGFISCNGFVVVKSKRDAVGPISCVGSG